MFDYSEVVSDLIARRDALGTAIATLQKLGASSPAKQDGPAPIISRRAATKKIKKPVARRKYAPRDAEADEQPEARKPGITDAIRQAVRESPRTSIEIADRVETLIPGVSRASVSSIILQRMQAGEFRKDEYLKVHLASGRAA